MVYVIKNPVTNKWYRSQDLTNGHIFTDDLLEAKHYSTLGGAKRSKTLMSQTIGVNLEIEQIDNFT